jgi:hypothetical protein
MVRSMISAPFKRYNIVSVLSNVRGGSKTLRSSINNNESLQRQQQSFLYLSMQM